MNYEKNYYDYINYVKSLNRVKGSEYFECHHIIPKCLGGSNSPENLVLLTAREHILAHYLLTKIYPNNLKLANAFQFMLTNSNGRNSKSYAFFRKLAAQKQSELMTGTKASEQTKLKERQVRKKYLETHENNFKGKKHSISSREQMSKARKFKIICLENNKTYNTRKEAAEDLNICSPDLIGKNLSGKIKSASGYHFKYSEEKKIPPKHTEQWNLRIAEANRRRVDKSAERN